MYKEVGDTRGLANTYLNLGMTHTDNHLYLMANHHLSMAEVMIEVGNSRMVQMCCARALDIYRQIGDHLGEADAQKGDTILEEGQ